MPETSVSEAALAAVPDEVRWCLRCLGWYAGEFKGNRGQFCQDVDFACSGAVGGPDEKCARCPPTAKHTCLTIPDSVWKLAREIIARRRAMVDFEKKNPMRDVSAADRRALKADFKIVRDRTREYYKDSERRDSEHVEDSEDEDDAPPRRKRPRRYTSSILYDDFHASEPETNRPRASVGPRVQGRSPAVPDGTEQLLQAASNAVKKVARLTAIKPEADKRFATAALQYFGLGPNVPNNEAPGVSQLLRQTGHHADGAAREAAGEVSRISGELKDAHTRLGEAVFAIMASGGVPPERSGDEQILGIPPSQWLRAQNVIARRRAILELRQLHPDAEISPDDTSAVVRALAAVQSGTENYYSRLEKNDDKDDDSDSDDAHEHDVRAGSLPGEADTRPRRSVPTVNYSRSALYPAKTLKAFRSAGKDRVSSKTSASNPAAAPIPRPVSRQNPVLPSAGPAEPVPAGSAVLDPGGIAGALAVSRHATPAPAAAMANPDRFARVIEAIGEVSRLTAARNEAINRLGEAFFDAVLPGEPAPVARLSDDQVQDVLRMLGHAGGNVGNE
ncbi:hypothetical protein CGGC5_v011407 [Colletotrichum fructicola Nara gc5]|uniref:Uncharacterized protein n=1 Tax=Colletotrichum fructicola (strain Nara gc5) TaxID=1213859 RepID=A0A7J6IUX4_COLFN|nr:hypothetical protein CFRS1_v009900 [Colletotrichum fructicola]KAF4480296.1 hypothetical protein CGGC5_v011407 [Colletotrichum fructicola Nara gc5]